jgi:hypothetical protein
MSSRRKRKRERRQEAAEATATLETPRGVRGAGPRPGLSRSDLLVIRRAIRERWPVPPDHAAGLMAGVEAMATSDVARYTIAAAKVCLAIAWAALDATAPPGARRRGPPRGLGGY